MSDRCGSDKLSLWTVYDHPKDYPDCFVTRRSTVGPGGVVEITSDMFAADSLEELRALLPRGLVCIGRNPFDDPVIVEVWL